MSAGWDDVNERHPHGIRPSGVNGDHPFQPTHRPPNTHWTVRVGHWLLYLFGLILQVALLGFGGVLFYVGIDSRPTDWASLAAGIAALTAFLLAHEYDWRGGQ